ncbi:ATP-dependent 3'-5' DNA helicase [Aspergillus novofumigatus IBT 16806]|uniref:Putative DEAD/DEAH box helicase n=1 Tax=Aspergillus novofumigatus (strain IBT 16806) TaxID=1392255 RepID=A0A2I1CMN6_ASPN1|nr:putative DEAD/DEAH box helicase [Aspergillus novofumigatus IBT 16806]PKX98890.1 putative DEAD/DEAH box helicase [Aspergillus novofumigatus IBT 16806]
MTGPMPDSAPSSLALKRKRNDELGGIDDFGSNTPEFSNTKRGRPRKATTPDAALETETASSKTATDQGDSLDSNRDAIAQTGKSEQAKPNSKSTRTRAQKVTKSPSPKRTPSAPWPEAFKSLAQTHRALNLVYTFCCTRKHFATTFENIRKAVQAQLGHGRELTVEDIARVRVLVPRAVKFEYVDEAKLEVMTVGEKETARNQSYGLSHPECDAADIDADVQTKEVLLFEFLDGDLKREVRHPKNGEPTKPVRKMKDEDLKMPVYSQKQMLALIEKRNKKFSDAIDAFLVRCEDDGSDPVERLEREKDAWIPSPPVSEDDNLETAKLLSMPPREIPKERKSMAEIIEEIRAMDWYFAQIVPEGHRVFEAQLPVYGDLTFQLSQDLVNALYNTKGITQFYSHQAEAINSLYAGQDVIVSTSTSSGKSLIYQVPMLHELGRDPNSRGMYIFPTKALAQDQKRSMKELLQFMDGLQDVMVETFDGDTPMGSRNLIRDEARIIFTNPDMLHITILPQESSWRTFLKNLKFVVVDELHVYNGLFGSHVAFIMRRLHRICAAVGNRHVRFISCSATVANPEEHMKAVFGIDDVRLIDFDGSPSGRKEFLCWNTPYKDPNDSTSGRGDSVAETARLFCQLILRGARVIAFCRIRKTCEILLQAVRNEFQAIDRPEVGKLVMGYRGGYSPQDRRKIEKEMFEGHLLGIVATNALELGVDIGSLDAVITLGFPYSISNLRQQSGRAGRRNKDSLSVLVGDRYPTDQYYMQNPDELFTKPNCELQIDLSNELILEGHMPIRPDEDRVYFGEQLHELAATRLVKDTFGFRPHPSRCVPIRDTEDQHFAIIDATNARNVILEEVEASRGIFLHQGQTYLRFARVLKVHRDYTDIDPIETELMRQINQTSASRAFYGSVQIHAVRGRVLDAVAVDNPPIDIFTKGMWLDILESRRLNIAAAIHAAEHAVLSLLPTFVISSPGDVKTECKIANEMRDQQIKENVRNLQPPARQRPARLTFYDAKGGSKAFEFIDVLLRRACITPQGCMEELNSVMSKAGARVVLRCLLGWDVDIDALPWDGLRELAGGLETVIPATEVPLRRQSRNDGA